MSGRKPERVAIVGAGLSAPVLAVFLARRGCETEIYERRPDPRRRPPTLRPSINITLCERGLRALDAVGFGHRVAELAVPAYGRGIHMAGGEVEYQPYGNDREALPSLSRRELSLALLDHAEREAGVRIHFEQRFVVADFAAMRATFEHTGTGVRSCVPFSRLIGADGVHS